MCEVGSGIAPRAGDLRNLRDLRNLPIVIVRKELHWTKRRVSMCLIMSAADPPHQKQTSTIITHASSKEQITEVGAAMYLFRSRHVES